MKYLHTFTLFILYLVILTGGWFLLTDVATAVLKHQAKLKNHQEALKRIDEFYLGNSNV